MKAGLRGGWLALCCCVIWELMEPTITVFGS